MKNIKHLLDIVDGVRDNVALGLMSDPGLSKTAQVKQWAEDNNRRYCELIISQRMPSEISGMPMPVAPIDGKSHGTMEVYDFNTLLELKDGDVLAFDEFTNGNIQTLNACLTLIQERVMLSGKKLPSLVIVAMGNPQGRCELLPQTKQRFWWVNVTWDEPSWRTYMLDTWKIVPSKYVFEAIKKQYQRGFAGAGEFNYLTPRTMENLFRIAQCIERDDVFWTLGDIDTRLVEEIYKSLTNVTTYSKVAPKLEQWGAATAIQFEGTDEAELVIEMMAELAACNSPDDVKAVVVKLQSDFRFDSIIPGFIDYLKTTGIDDENGDPIKMELD